MTGVGWFPFYPNLTVVDVSDILTTYFLRFMFHAFVHHPTV